MDPIFPQPGRTAPLSLPAAPPISTAPLSPVPAMWPRDRIVRIAALSHDDTAAGLLWLAMNFPAVCDATTAGRIEVFDPGHDPVVAWRLPLIPAAR